MDFDLLYIVILILLKVSSMAIAGTLPKQQGIYMDAGTRNGPTSSDTSTSLSQLKKRFYGNHQTNWILPTPPHVSVRVITPVSGESNHVTRVPLSPDMTMVDALIASVQQSTTDQNDSAFNVRVSWEPTHQCNTISEALGIDNSRQRQWVVTVKNMNNQIVYRSPCLPLWMVLRPNDDVSISYGRPESV